MPTARRMRDADEQGEHRQQHRRPTSPVAKAGSTTWSVDQPSTQASATVSAPNSTLPSVESVKIHGSRRIATPSTAKPSRVVDRVVRRAAVTRSLCAPPSPRSTPRQRPRPLRLFAVADIPGIALIRPVRRLRRMTTRRPRPTERVALCDLALEVGADAPTLCGDWTVKDLVAHLLVRERSLWRSLGISSPPLAGLTDREMARAAHSRTSRTLVDRLRRATACSAGASAGGSRWSTPWSTSSTTRTSAGPSPTGSRVRSTSHTRPRSGVDHALPGGGWCGRPACRWSSARRPTPATTATLRRGADPVTVTGPPGEIVLFLYGRGRPRAASSTGPGDIDQAPPRRQPRASGRRSADRVAGVGEGAP